MKSEKRFQRNKRHTRSAYQEWGESFRYAGLWLHSFSCVKMPRMDEMDASRFFLE